MQNITDEKVPKFVQNCIARLESDEEFMQSLGIYRVSGPVARIQALRFQVQSVKSRHQYLRFFGQKVVNIAIIELGPVSNESLVNSTYYWGNLKFLNPFFEK